MKELTSIILATYNEKENIVSLINTIIKECENNKVNIEIIVVDDNSPDGTAKTVKKAFGKNKGIKLIVRKDEKGLGTAVGRGVKESKGEVVVFMDADFSHDPKDISNLIKLTNNFDIVNGSRYIRGGGIQTHWNRKLATNLMRIYMSTVLQLNITDYTNGYFAVRKSVLNKLSNEKIFYGYGDYYFRFFYYAKKQGAKIKEIPVFYKFREHGQSKTNHINHGWQYIKEALKLRLGM